MKKQIPQHIGYIVDGNRRWAKERGLTTYRGHLAGYSAVKVVAQASFQAGIKYVSAYIFSTENWKRSEGEVSKLMQLMTKFFTTDLHYFMDNNIRLVVFGSRDGLGEGLLKAIDAAIVKTAKNTAGTLALCLNYGGQLEIADACKKIVQSGADADDITPELIAANLYQSEIPPCDLVVRTSGEQRLSNFMLWRAAYSELLFLDKYWPDMTAAVVDDILDEYARRNRRFGG